MGLFFEVRFDFVAPGRSREIGRGLQVSKPLGFLVDPNDNERALRLINGAPAEFGLCLLTKICSGVKLESLRSNKRATRKNKILQSLTKSHAFYGPTSLLLGSLQVLLINLI